MDEKFALTTRNQNCAINKLKQNLSLNTMDSSNISPNKSSNIQATYDIISVLYAKEIENITKILTLRNKFKFFVKENFSKFFEDFREKFKKVNLNIVLYQVKNIDEVILNIPEDNNGVVLLDVLNDKNDANLFSEFLNSKNIVYINFSNCNTVLINKMSVNVDLKKYVSKDLTSQEKLEIILDCVYLNLQAKKILDLNFKI